jgi:hypothetical protein
MNAAYHDWLEDRLELFFGEASPAAARIYAQLVPSPELAAPTGQLVGSVKGPYCRHSQTLPATVPLRGRPARGDKAPLLAEAVVPDPCFWTPELPLEYRVSVAYQESGVELAKVERWFAIRPLAGRAGLFRLAGHVWILRGAQIADPDRVDLAEWQKAGLALAAVDPSEALCAEASRAGVIIVARLGDSTDPQTAIRRWGRHPAVGMIVVPRSVALPTEARAWARNTLLVETLAGADAGIVAGWAGAGLLELDRSGPSAEAFDGAASYAAPVIVFGAGGDGAERSARELRAACDRIRAACAPYFQCAGYLVEPG